LSLDLLEKEAQIIRLHDEAGVSEAERAGMLPLDTAKGKKLIQLENPTVQPSNAIQMELASFAKAIHDNTPPIVGIEDGFLALDTAHWIQREMEKSAKLVDL